MTESTAGSGNITSGTVGVALDMDTGTATIYHNNTIRLNVSDIPAGAYYPFFLADSGTDQFYLNAGQRPFAYTAPSGFKAVCTQNLPTPTIGATTATQATNYFSPVLYTGTGSSQSITGLNFQPDLVWTKSRSNAYNNTLVDAVRGVSKALVSDLTAAEDNSPGSYVTAFNSGGFSVGTGTGSNGSGATYVAWNWKANGAGSTNTAGSITSTVSASATSGFSVVTYTGTGANATVGHGLGVAPKFIITKKRSSTSNWAANDPSRSNPWSGALLLNTTDAFVSSSAVWNDTAPTTTVFSIGTADATNVSSATYVAYCFAPIAGYSAIGFYTGNGSTDGAFVYCGFRPACIIFKVSDGAASWLIHDIKRNTNNVVDKKLFPNLSDAEATADVADFLSNGFKLRGTNTQFNGNGYNYIFAAFAENPFKYSLAR